MAIPVLCPYGPQVYVKADRHDRIDPLTGLGGTVTLTRCRGNIEVVPYCRGQNVAMPSKACVPGCRS